MRIEKGEYLIPKGVTEGKHNKMLGNKITKGRTSEKILKARRESWSRDEAHVGEL